MFKLTMTIKELCDCLGIGRTTAYRLIGEFEVDSLRIGGRRLVTVESVHDLVKRSADIELLTELDAVTPLEPIPLRLVPKDGESD